MAYQCVALFSVSTEPHLVHIRGALVLGHSMGDASRAKMMSWMKMHTKAALWKLGEPKAKGAPSPSVYCAGGKSFEDGENCSVVAICHLCYINPRHFCFHGGPEPGAISSPLHSLPENLQEIRTSLDKWIRCGPGSFLSPAGARKVLWLQDLVVLC